MEKKFVGQVEVSGCGDNDVVTLCVEALNATDARNGMETVVMSRYSSYGSITNIHEATEEEARTLPVDIPEDPA